MWAYDQTYGGSISKKHGSMVSNTALLIGRAVTSVYAKVVNFRSLDPRTESAGISSVGEMDRKVWTEFSDPEKKEIRSDLLDDEFRRIWHGGGESVPPPRPLSAGFGEAPNDDPAELRAFSRVLRRGQSAFRSNLIAANEGRCCASGWGPEAVLEAAQFEEHSRSGLNSVSNGLVLRSDLHVLFDER